MPVAKKTPKKAVKSAVLPVKKKEQASSEAVMPLYAGILLLILGIVAGFGFHALFFPQEIIIQAPSESGLEQPSLEFSLLTHPDCKLCSSQSSFELLLKQRGIDVNVKLIDATASEGTSLADSLGVDSFPTVIVSASDFKEADPALFANLQTLFSEKNGFLVLPEKDLMHQTKLPSSYMLKEIPEGLSCEIPDGKALVWEFGDLLASSTYDALPSVSEMLTKMGNELEYNFKYLYVSNLDSESAAIADSCSKKFGVFEFYHKGLLERWHSLNLPIWTWAEQQKVAEQISLEDVNGLKDCIDAKEPLETVAFQTGTDTLLAQSLVLQQVPSFVIDCRFVVINPLKLEEAVCKQHPELSACESA